jgi:hypothetical protein
LHRRAWLFRYRFGGRDSDGNEGGLKLYRKTIEKKAADKYDARKLEAHTDAP